jgi:hypothetical protein
MRFHPKATPLLFLICTAVIPAAAQEKRVTSNGPHRVTREENDLRQKPTKLRTVSMGDGLAILGAALDSRRHADSLSDCSHFVHGLYERAGFPYEYASSLDLYTGIDEFQRVASPQPGDLAVWRGHAGIVVNPVQGPGVDSYDSPYWKQRGRPRFFRYVKAAPSDGVSSSIRAVSLKPSVLGTAKPHETAAEDPVPDVLEESASETGSSAKLAESQPVNITTPRVLVVNSVRPKPDQVGAAFLQACADAEESVRGRDLLKPTQSLIVFDHVAVRKVHITENKGWAEVQIDELVALTGSKAEAHKRSERQRWPLSRRSSTSWELTPSRDTIYLPQHVAVRILAQALAKLTEDSPETTSKIREKAELARLLDVLLKK